MPNEGLISTLSIKVQADAENAVDSLTKLRRSLDMLKTTVSGIKVGNITGISDGIEKIANTAKSLDDTSIDNISKLGDALVKLSNTRKSSIGKDFADALETIVTQAKSIDQSAIDGIANLTVALDYLSDAGESTAVTARYSNSMNRIIGSVEAANYVETKGIEDIVIALGDLSNTKPTKAFNSTAGAVSKVTSALGILNGMDIDVAKQKMAELKDAMNTSLVGDMDTESFTKTASALARSINALTKLDVNTAADNIEYFSTALQVGIDGFKANEDFTKMTSAFARAVNTVTKMDSASAVTKITQFTSALNNSIAGLTGNTGTYTLNTIVSAFSSLTKSVNRIPADAAAKIKEFTDAVSTGTKGFGGSENFISVANSMSKAINSIAEMDIDKITENIQKFTTAIQPMVTALQQAQPALTAFASAMSQFNTYNNKATSYSSSSSNGSKSTLGILTNFSKYFNVRFLISGIRSLISSIKSCVDEATEYEETLNLFNVAMGTGAEEAYEFAESVSELVGVDIAEWMEGQGTFNTLIEGFGVASDRAQTMSKQLAQLAYDISSYYNTSVEDAFAKLESGMSGSARAVRSYGIDVSEMKLKEVALELGIEKSVSAMNQAEKAQLRYYTIMKQSVKVQGDMGRTIQTPANQLRILAAQAQMAARAIGNLFIPALNAILPVAIVVIKAITAVTRAIASLFGYQLTDVDYSGLTDLGAETDSLTDSLDSAGESAEKLKSYVMGFDELNIIDTSSSSGGGSDSSTSVGSDWDWELPTYDFLEGLTEGSLFNTITERLNQFTEDVSKLIEQQDYHAVGESIGDLFNEAIESVDWKELGNNAASKVNDIISTLDGFLSKADFLNAGVAFGDMLNNFISNIDSKAIGNTAMSVVTGIFDSVIGFITTFDIGELFDAIENLISGAFEKLKSWFYTINWSAFFKEAVGKLTDLLSGLISSAEQGAGIFGELSVMATNLLISFVRGVFTTENVLNILVDFVLGPIGVAITSLKGFFTGLFDGFSNFSVDDPYGDINTDEAEDEINSIASAAYKASAMFDILSASISDSNDAMSLGKEVSEKYENGIDSFLDDSTVETAASLVDKIYELNEYSDGSNTAFNVMKGYVETLNAMGLDGLQLSIDETTGKIVEEKDEIYAVIEAMKEQAKQTALQNVLVQAYEDQYEVQHKLKEETEKYNSIVKQLHSVQVKMNTIVDKTSAEYKELELQEADLIEAYNASKDAINELNDAYGDTEDIIEDVSGAFAFAESTIDDFDISGASAIGSEAAEKIKEAFSDGMGDGIKVSASVTTPTQKQLNEVGYNIASGIDKGVSSYQGSHTDNGIGVLKYAIKHMAMAAGGLVSQGQMFIAREAGPEMVGTIGGHTAVANNDQIVQGISSGVYAAVTSAMSQSNGTTSVNVYLDGKQIRQSLIKANHNAGVSVGKGGVLVG